jgi:hypothetical protein
LAVLDALTLAVVEVVLDEPPHAASPRLARRRTRVAAVAATGLLLMGEIRGMELLVDDLLADTPHLPTSAGGQRYLVVVGLLGCLS